MTHQSAPQLLILHAVRLLGFADSAALAERSGASGDEVTHLLRDAQRHGWVHHVEFAEHSGWSLTDAGRTENEHQLAVERNSADPVGAVPSVYRDFLPLNTRLLRAVTDWQIRPTSEARFTPNTHTDNAWDQRVLDELVALGAALSPLTDRLCRVLARFDGYAARYEVALHKALSGQHHWVDTTGVDSCHRVWFQLHEDLVATLGIDRRTEV